MGTEERIRAAFAPSVEGFWASLMTSQAVFANCLGVGHLCSLSPSLQWVDVSRKTPFRHRFRQPVSLASAGFRIIANSPIISPHA